MKPLKTKTRRRTVTLKERKQLREFVTRWERVGPLLEQIRIQEMRSPDYGKRWDIVDSLLEMSAFHRLPRATSGLVEQQRRFARLRT